MLPSVDRNKLRKIAAGDCRRADDNSLLPVYSTSAASEKIQNQRALSSHRVGDAKMWRSTNVEFQLSAQEINIFENVSLRFGTKVFVLKFRSAALNLRNFKPFADFPNGKRRASIRRFFLTI